MKDWFSKLQQNPHFWEVAFVFALILLILTHKLTLEAVVES